MNIEEIEKKLGLLEQDINSLNTLYDQENGAKLKIVQEKERYEKNISKNEELIDAYNIKSLLINNTAKLARQQGKDMFSRMSTHGLQLILGDHLSVNIIDGKRGNSPTLDFKIISQYDDYTIEASPTEGEGGGVADIVALSSFLNLNYLNTEINKAPLILDEPTKYVSKGNAEYVSNFIKEIADTTNKQIIMSTHDIASEHIADNVFMVKQEDGISQVINIKKEEE